MPLRELTSERRRLRDAAFAGYAVNVSFTTAVFFAFLTGAALGFPMIAVMCGAAVIAFLGYVLARLALARRPAAATAAGDD